MIFLPVLLLAWTLPGCSWEWAHRIYPLPFYETSVTVGGEPDRVREMPGKIAILPFTYEQEDNLERQEAVRTLRESFCNALERLRSYDYIPIEEVDRRLADAGLAENGIEGTDLQTLARIVGADTVLFGSIKRTRNLTLYLYSHTVYEGTFMLVDAATRDVLWSGRLWEGLRGGLFVDLFVVDMFMEQPKNKRLAEAYRSVSDIMAKKLVATLPERTATADTDPEAE